MVDQGFEETKRKSAEVAHSIEEDFELLLVTTYLKNNIPVRISPEILA